MSGLNRLFGALTALFAVTTLPAGVLAGMFLGGQAAAIVFVVGWFLLVPVAAILAGTLSDPAAEIERATELQDLLTGTDNAVTTSDDRTDEDPLQTLRRRYADGEIDERELERGLEALLETEDATAEDTDAIRKARDRVANSETETARRSAENDSREPAVDIE